MGKYVRRVIPTNTWSATSIDGKEVWVYHNAGHSVDLSLSFTDPKEQTGPDEREVTQVTHKNIFEKNE